MSAKKTESLSDPRQKSGHQANERCF